MFDGDCGFCTSSARWVEARLPSDARVEPWQRLDLEELGLTEAQVTESAWLIDDDGRAHRGHAAIGRALTSVGGVWGTVGRLIIVPPTSWLAGVVYSLVARYRYRLPGATDACRIER